MSPHSRVVTCCLVLSLAATATQAKQQIEVAWRQGEVSIDGSADDWQGALMFVEGPKLLIGARNDADDLYLCIYSRDPAVARRALGRGLILRLETKGSDPIRLQFPVGGFHGGGPPSRADVSGEPINRRRTGSRDTFVLLGRGPADRQQIPVENNFGIELRVGGERGEFIYEAKIPLAKSEAHPYALGAHPGSKLTLFVDPPPIDRDDVETGGDGPPRGMGNGDNGGGGHGGMGRGGMGGGGHGGMGGRPGGRGGGRPREGLGEDRFQNLEPLKLRASLHLAKPPSSSAAPER